MGGIGVHYAKLNQPGIERQILHVLTHSWKSQNIKLKAAESRMIVPRGWGERNGGTVVQGYKASIRQEECVLIFFEKLMKLYIQFLPFPVSV
jgi:hypothetical protein